MKRGVSKSFLTIRYMPKYKQINLQDMIEEIGEDRTKDILSDFLCDKNMDVQEFLRRKAIEFSKRGFAKTTLVFWVSDNDKEKYLVGYFALSNKNNWTLLYTTEPLFSTPICDKIERTKQEVDIWRK